MAFTNILAKIVETPKEFFIPVNQDSVLHAVKKATEQWIAKNLTALPNNPWQHITFTLPSELRAFFWLNRQLLNHIANKAAKILTTLAKKKKLIPSTFMAIHTFGRDLKIMFISTYQLLPGAYPLITQNGFPNSLLIIKPLKASESNR